MTLSGPLVAPAPRESHERGMPRRRRSATTWCAARHPPPRSSLAATRRQTRRPRGRDLCLWHRHGLGLGLNQTLDTRRRATLTLPRQRTTLGTRCGSTTMQTWFRGLNPSVGNTAPVRLLRRRRPAEVNAFPHASARSFARVEQPHSQRPALVAEAHRSMRKRLDRR